MLEEEKKLRASKGGSCGRCVDWLISHKGIHAAEFQLGEFRNATISIRKERRESLQPTALRKAINSNIEYPNLSHSRLSGSIRTSKAHADRYQGQFSQPSTLAYPRGFPPSQDEGLASDLGACCYVSKPGPSQRTRYSQFSILVVAYSTFSRDIF